MDGEHQAPAVPPTPEQLKAMLDENRAQLQEAKQEIAHLRVSGEAGRVSQVQARDSLRENDKRIQMSKVLCNKSVSWAF